MKIYTFYEKVFDKQEELIDLWKINWSKKGFDPIVLSIKDSEKSSLFEEFSKKINLIHRDIVGKNISRYGLACYYRWIAYSLQDNEEAFLVSDYDIININFKIEDCEYKYGKISFLNRFCPCLALGKSNDYKSFVEDILYISEKYLLELKKEFNSSKFIQYHDQEFLSLNSHRLNYNFYDPQKIVRLYRCNEEIKNQKVLHFSHTSIYEFKKIFQKYAQDDEEELRIKLIKSII
jgi:hypothetical protein